MYSSFLLLRLSLSSRYVKRGIFTREFSCGTFVNFKLWLITTIALCDFDLNSKNSGFVTLMFSLFSVFVDEKLFLVSPQFAKFQVDFSVSITPSLRDCTAQFSCKRENFLFCQKTQITLSQSSPSAPIRSSQRVMNIWTPVWKQLNVNFHRKSASWKTTKRTPDETERLWVSRGASSSCADLCFASSRVCKQINKREKLSESSCWCGSGILTH